MQWLTLGCITTGLLLGSAAIAETNPPANQREQPARIGSLEDYDIDHDRRISAEEARRDGRLAAYFVVLDADRDGFVDETELEQNREQALSSERVQRKLDSEYEDIETDPDLRGAARTSDVDRASDMQGFDAYDINRDDRISREEARDDETLKRQFISWDADHDGHVSERELEQGQARQKENDDRDVSRHDTDGDGRISASEANDDERLQREFETIDANNDDYLDANEITYDPDTRRSNGGNNFRSIDVNRDGYLAPSEAANDTYVDANFENWDINSDGVLDDGEIDNDWAEWDRDSFDTVDGNGDGMIDANEAAESGYVDYSFDSWDMDGDGRVSRQEANAGWMGEDEGRFDKPAW